MTLRTRLLLGLGVLIAVAAGVAYMLFQHAAQFARSVPAAPVALAPAPAPAPTASVQPPAECLLPGPPPVPPNGATATNADMKLGHDVIQAFVHELEAYQACRNNQIDHASASVSAQQKQTWIDEGNSAVDEANEVANAFSVQLKIFKARKLKP